MRTLDLVQHSPEWKAHRAAARNASEAPIVMCESSNTTRTELVRLKALGDEKQYSRWVEEVLFERGHAVEPALRAIVEAMIGDDLYPIIATSDDGFLSASFDGVTMAETIFAECKQSNADKIEAVKRREIPAVDRWQIVHQFDVNDSAERCIYIVGDGTENGSYTLEIKRSDIEADIETLRLGWAQFDEDVANYVAPPATTAVAVAVEQLPAVSVRIDGTIAVASNLDLFADALRSFIDRIDKQPSTDQAFAEAEAAIKTLQNAQDALEAAKASGLAQVATVDEMVRTVDNLSGLARSTRLSLEKMVKTRKDEIRAEIAATARNAWIAHERELNNKLAGRAAISIRMPDFAGAMRGKKTLDTLRSAVNDALAMAKVEATREAGDMLRSIGLIDEIAKDHPFLVRDIRDLVTVNPEHIPGIIKGRIAEYEAKQQRKLEAERERIRQEEEARAQREAEQKAEQERQRIREEEAAKLRAEQEARANRAAAESLAIAQQTVRAMTQDTHTPPPAFGRPAPAPAAAGLPPEASPVAAARPETGARIKLGDINAAIAPLQISADGLARLGFTHVEVDRAAKLYRASDLPRILTAMIAHLQCVAANHGNRKVAA